LAAVAGGGFLHAQEAKEAHWEKLSAQALDLDKQGKYDEALPLALEGLKEAQATLDPDDPMLAFAMGGLAQVCRDQGDYAKAEALDLRAVALVEKVLGPQAPELAPFLINLANVYSAESELAKAEPLLLRVLGMDEKKLKPDSPELAGDLNNLGTVYFQQGKYEKAEPLFERALRIDTKAAAGEDNAAVANDMGNLGLLYDQQAKFAEAEPLLKRCLEIDEKVKGADHPDVGMDLVNLGVLYVDEAKYQAAEEVYQHAEEILEKALGPDHANVAMVLSKLALVDDHLSKYAEAEPLFKRALSIDEKAFGDSNRRVATDLSNLAMLDEHRNQYVEARPLFERALSIDEKALGPDHSDVAILYDNLGEVDLYQSQFAQAEAHYQQSLKIMEKAEGSNHTDVAHTLDDLANLYDAMGRYAKAEQAARRAIAIQEKAEGPDHPDLATDLTNFGLLYEYQGKYAQAQPLFQRAFDNLFKQFQYNFTYMTEKERLGFLDTVANDFPAYFSFVHRFRDKDPELIGSMYNLLLWEKGFIAGSVADMRRQIEASGDAASLKLLGELTEKRTQIAALLNEQPQDRDAWRKQIDQLRGEADELEKALVARSSTYAERKKLDRSTWQQVRDALGPGEAAVEFARFRYYDGKWTDKNYYAALVVTRETKDEPEYVFLGENAEIEGDAITHFRQQLQTRGVGVVEEAALPGQDAYGLIWKPLEPALSGRTRVYLSPDGILNQLPLGIIAGPDGKLEMEKYDLRLVSSTRDILRTASPHGADTAVLVGNPVFALSEEAQRAAQQRIGVPHEEPAVETASLTGSEVSRDQGTGTTLPPLAGTGAEIDAIAGLMRERQWKTGLYTGDLALKRVVEETSSPRVVHLATHGFFLADQQAKASQLEAEQVEQQPLGLEDPMLRSGLYFAGADRTLQGKPSAPDVDNGVLTAVEAANLNLHGTELVVLSACNTGQGDVKNGEGVFGLRRALEEAGAQNVLMSLWSVPDQETLELMRRFYAKWLAGTEVHAALQQAQLEMRDRVKAAHDGKDLPYYWGAFVLVGR
jgi:CHAT domain-containing protein/Tfp pilus assembly protein PilF